MKILHSYERAFTQYCYKEIRYTPASRKSILNLQPLQPKANLKLAGIILVPPQRRRRTRVALSRWNQTFASLSRSLSGHANAQKTRTSAELQECPTATAIPSLTCLTVDSVSPHHTTCSPKSETGVVIVTFRAKLEPRKENQTVVPREIGNYSVFFGASGLCRSLRKSRMAMTDGTA